MDTLVSEIVVQAFREGNFTAVGETTTAEEMIEAVPRLRNFISSLFGLEIGEALRDWYVPHEHNPAQPLRHPLTPTGDGAVATQPWAWPAANARLLVTSTTPRTLYFHQQPNDGARMAFVDMGGGSLVTLSGNGRLIEGAPILTALPSALNGRVWLYRADRAEWILLERLDENSRVPLPNEFDDLLVCGLCMRLAPRFSVKPDEVIVARYEDMVGRLRKRYKQSERMPSSAELRSTFRSEI